MENNGTRKRRATIYTVDVLRRQWIEAMIREGVGRLERSKHPPGLSRAEIAQVVATRPPPPGKYFPVSREEVDAAREAAFACGVTFRTWMHWHLLRRNYEANPAVLRGPRKKVVRDALPMMSSSLFMNLKKPGMSMQRLADMLDQRSGTSTEIERQLRQEIANIFTDMRRRLWPRRSRIRSADAARPDYVPM